MKRFCSEATRKKRSESAKKRWNNPEFRNRVCIAMKRKIIEEPIFCLCGCGKLAKSGNEFVHGHNAKNGNHPMLGRKHSEETRKKLSESHKGQIPWIAGKTHSPEVRKRLSESHKGVPLSKEHCQSLSRVGLGKPHPGAKGRISLMKGRHHSEEAKRKNSETKRLAWKEHPELAKKCLGFKSPNKCESKLMSILQSMYPEEWKFVGDGQIVINGKCPDYINVNGQKKIIELWGERWHQNDNPQDRIEVFKPFGYETLIIWVKELESMKNLRHKLTAFCLGDSLIAEKKGGCRDGE